MGRREYKAQVARSRLECHLDHVLHEIPLPEPMREDATRERAALFVKRRAFESWIGGIREQIPQLQKLYGDAVLARALYDRASRTEHPWQRRFFRRQARSLDPNVDTPSMDSGAQIPALDYLFYRGFSPKSSYASR